MIRMAFRMSVNGDRHEDYARRHNPIWPELEDTLLAHGVQSYSIYLDPETSDLFAYAEVDSEERWRAIAQTDVCRRWWRHMREVMPSNADDSPVSRDLREVFHIENRPDHGAAGAGSEGERS
jgi:L-rhamnose mutarotase